MIKKTLLLGSSFILGGLLVANLFYAPLATSKPHTNNPTAVHAAVQTQVTKEETTNRWNVNPRVWNLALKAYNKALQKGYVKQHVVTIIDYSLPSTQKRLWVVDLNNKKLLFNTHVAHGKYTGGLFAKHFSNKPGSQSSSIGTFVTENTYIGSHGYSLRLRGLEPGYNEKAKSRAIVIHGAWYASQDFAKYHGRLGLSWGCPAVSTKISTPLINHIKNGSLVFAYYPDPSWLKHSKFLT